MESELRIFSVSIYIHKHKQYTEKFVSFRLLL